LWLFRYGIFPKPVIEDLHGLRVQQAIITIHPLDASLLLGSQLTEFQLGFMRALPFRSADTRCSMPRRESKPKYSFKQFF